MPSPQAEAERVLREAGQYDSIPVDVEAIARHLAAAVIRERLDRDVSGLLFRDKDSAVIGVNDLHAPKRQRFTVAHEVGHLVLHRGRPLVLDHVRVNFRDANSSTATDSEEIQANAFAAEILMPRHSVVAEAKRLLEDPSATDASIVSDLAQGFDVSDQAMEYRLINLGLRRQV